MYFSLTPRATIPGRFQGSHIAEVAWASHGRAGLAVEPAANFLRDRGRGAAPPKRHISYGS